MNQSYRSSSALSGLKVNDKVFVSIFYVTLKKKPLSGCGCSYQNRFQWKDQVEIDYRACKKIGHAVFLEYFNK